MIVSKRKTPFSLQIDKTQISDKNFEILITLLTKANNLRNLRISNANVTL